MFVGSFIIRRPVGWSQRWEYATGRRRRERLGLAGSITAAVWSRHRSKARRFESRRSAARWLHREGPWSPGAEVVRVASWFGPLADAECPRERQDTFAFLTGGPPHERACGQ